MYSLYTWENTEPQKQRRGLKIIEIKNRENSKEEEEEEEEEGRMGEFGYDTSERRVKVWQECIT